MKKCCVLVAVVISAIALPALGQTWNLANDFPDANQGGTNPGNGWAFVSADRGANQWVTLSKYVWSYLGSDPTGKLYAIKWQWDYQDPCNIKMEPAIYKNISASRTLRFWGNDGLAVPAGKVCLHGDYPARDTVAKWIAPTAGTYDIQVTFTFASFYTFTLAECVTVHVRKDTNWNGGMLNTTTLFTDPNMGDGTYAGHTTANFTGKATVGANGTIEFWAQGRPEMAGEAAVGWTRDGVVVDATITTAAVSIIETGGSTVVKEGMTTDSLDVVRTGPNPTANVSVTLTPSAGLKLNGNAAGAPVIVTFTPGGATSQTITVAAIEDGIPQGIHNGTIAYTVASSDTVYNNQAPPSTSVVISDKCETYLPEDVNFDCVVDFKDFSKMAANWLQNSNQ